MERDEVYVPKTREDLGIPDMPSHEIDWDEVFGDTPIYTLLMLIRQQLLAFPAYLGEFMFSRPSVQPLSLSSILPYDKLYLRFPFLHFQRITCQARRTIPSGQIISVVRSSQFYSDRCVLISSFEANSILFTKDQRNAVILSNLGLLATLYIVTCASLTYGFGTVAKFYGVPWMALNHWCKHFATAAQGSPFTDLGVF